jgi:RND family efflux transporter MFP subunit
MKSILLNGILICMAVYLASCTARTEPIKKIESVVIPVKIIPVKQNYSQGKIAVSGKFTTDDEVMLSFKITGIIDKMYAKEGDAVRKDQLLATLNLTEINASLQQAQLAYDKAVRDQQRVQNLYNDSVATLEQVQNAKTAADLAAQQLNSARFNRRFSEIRAEANGFILRKLANEGQQVSSGNAVFETNGAGSGKWILRTGVTDKQWATIQAGDLAEVSIASDNGQKLNGIVTRKSEAVDPANGLFSIDIKIEGNHQGKIATGMFGNGTITTRRLTKEQKVSTVWSVPFESLLDGDGSNGWLFITNDNKTAHRVKVKIAGMEKDQVIISEGLENAGSLIVSGNAYLTDNSSIIVTQ